MSELEIIVDEMARAVIGAEKFLENETPRDWLTRQLEGIPEFIDAPVGFFKKAVDEIMARYVEIKEKQIKEKRKWENMKSKSEALYFSMKKWDDLSKGSSRLDSVMYACSLCAYAQPLEEISTGCTLCPLHMSGNSCFGDSREIKWYPQSPLERMREIIKEHYWGDRTLKEVRKMRKDEKKNVDFFELKFLAYQMRDLIGGLFLAERELEVMK